MNPYRRFSISLTTFGGLLVAGSLLDFYTVQHSLTNTAVGNLLMGLGVISISFGTFFRPGQPRE